MPFAAAADLQMRLYVAHRHLASPPHFRIVDGFLAWTKQDVAVWIRAQGDAYAPMVGASWTAAALVAMTPAHIAAACKGRVDGGAADAIIKRFAAFVAQQRLPEWYADYAAYAVRA